MSDRWLAAAWYLRRHWRRALVGAVVGASTFIIIGEATRAAIGKPSLFGLFGIGDYG